MISSLYLPGWQTINKKNNYQFEYFQKKFNNIFVITKGEYGSINKEFKQNTKLKIIIENKIFKRIMIYIFFLLKDKSNNKVAIISPYGLTAIIFFLISKIFRLKIITVELGPIDFFSKKNILERLFVYIIYKYSNLVWIKEPYMKKKLSFINQEKIYLISNCVIPEKNLTKKNENIDFLWVNRFADSRTPEIIIDAMNLLIKKRNFFSVFLGDIQKQFLYLNNTNYIKVLSYQEPNEYYVNSKFFVCSGKRIFGNNALLESMNNGIIPIVNQSEDIDKIIKHGVNGFICDNNKESFFNILNYCLNLDNRETLILSKAAAKTIKLEFNNKIWNKKMDSLFKNINL